jgi:putative ABC transport system substrate-binding protein
MSRARTSSLTTGGPRIKTSGCPRRRVAVIAASGGLASESAAKATGTIPIVFMVPEDPVRMGLVTSLARPDGNLTGVNFFAAELAAKRLGLLRELVPAVRRVAVLLNPAEATIAASNLRDMETAARTMSLQIQVFNAYNGAPTCRWLDLQDFSNAGSKA